MLKVYQLKLQGKFKFYFAFPSSLHIVVKEAAFLNVSPPEGGEPLWDLFWRHLLQPKNSESGDDNAEYVDEGESEADEAEDERLYGEVPGVVGQVGQDCLVVAGQGVEGRHRFVPLNGQVNSQGPEEPCHHLDVRYITLCV